MQLAFGVLRSQRRANLARASALIERSIERARIHEVNMLEAEIASISERWTDKDLSKAKQVALKALLHKRSLIKVKAIEVEAAGFWDEASKTNQSEQRDIVPPSELAEWAYHLMPAEILEDAIANLEEVYSTRILPKVCGGNELKARKVYRTQIFWIVAGHHSNKIKVALGVVATLLGFPQLAKILKGFRS
ncbi:hypothetical protein IWQ48_004219 [Labrenzia sp. EL_13]|nr:hypothetical protein [Labrenzia sp. EL_13]